MFASFRELGENLASRGFERESLEVAITGLSENNKLIAMLTAILKQLQEQRENLNTCDCHPISHGIYWSLARYSETDIRGAFYESEKNRDGIPWAVRWHIFRKSGQFSSDDWSLDGGARAIIAKFYNVSSSGPEIYTEGHVANKAMLMFRKWRAAVKRRRRERKRKVSK